MLPADLHIESLRTLLRDLINIYSPTGKEHEIVGFLFDYLKKDGLPVKMQQIGGRPRKPAGHTALYRDRGRSGGASSIRLRPMTWTCSAAAKKTTWSQDLGPPT